MTTSPQVFELVDPARPALRGSGPRPLRTTVWRPAAGQELAAALDPERVVAVGFSLGGLSVEALAPMAGPVTGRAAVGGP